MTENNDNSDIEVLKQMNDLTNQVPAAVENAKLDSNKPIKDVEESLSKFTNDTFDIIRDEYSFQKDIESEIQNRLHLEEKDGGFSANQLIALHTNNSVNLNDRVSKVLGPTFQLMTSKQQAEIAAEASQKANPSTTINIGAAGQDQMRSLNQDTPQQVLQGINAMAHLLNVLKTKQNAIAPEGTDDVSGKN